MGHLTSLVVRIILQGSLFDFDENWRVGPGGSIYSTNSNEVTGKINHGNGQFPVLQMTFPSRPPWLGDHHVLLGAPIQATQEARSGHWDFRPTCWVWASSPHPTRVRRCLMLWKNIMGKQGQLTKLSIWLMWINHGNLWNLEVFPRFLECLAGKE